MANIVQRGIHKVQRGIHKAQRDIYQLCAFRIVGSPAFYAVHEQAHLRRFLRLLEVDCVFDVGASHGHYALMLRKKAGFDGRIISFEPIPEAASAIRYQSERDPLWTVEEVALAGETCTREFHIMQEPQFSSLATPRHQDVSIFKDLNYPVKTVLVKTETLTEAFRRLQRQFGFSRPFLKLDSQGLDVEILGSGTEVALQFVGLQSELAIKRIYDRSVDFREALKFYQSLGFELSALVPNNAGHFPVLIEIDCIMGRKDILASYF
jgi:FkbM family methyltransferase